MIHTSFLGLPLFLYILAHLLRSPVIERGQNAKEKSNNWKKLLTAGILRDFFLMIWGDEKRHPTLGTSSRAWCPSGHVLLALFFKKLSLAIGQKQKLAFRLRWLAISLALEHARSSQANHCSRPSSPRGKKFPDMAQTIFERTT